MTQYIFYIMLFLATYLEGTLTTLPLVLALIIPYAVITQKENVFFAGFISGLVLDLMSGQTIGFTSFYFLCSVFALLLYQRKYEIASYPFIAIATAVLSSLYLFLFVHTHIVEQVVVSVILAEIWFIFFKMMSSSSQMRRLEN